MADEHEFTPLDEAMATAALINAFNIIQAYIEEKGLSQEEAEADEDFVYHVYEWYHKKRWEQIKKEREGRKRMSVLIKDIGLPNNCLHCPFSHMASDCLKIWIVCKVKDVSVTDGDAVEEGRPNWCPLVEIPSHGRLIDADAYHKEIKERYQSASEWYHEAETDDILARAESAMITFTECSLTLQKMPTVIEAEEET